MEDMSEEQLVLRQTLSVEDQVKRPRDSVVQREQLNAFEDLLRCEDPELITDGGQATCITAVKRIELLPSPTYLRVLEGEQLFDERVLTQLEREVFHVRVGRKTACPDGHLEETLQFFPRDDLRILRQFLLGSVQEVHEEVPFLQEKVALYRSQTAL